MDETQNTKKPQKNEKAESLQEDKLSKDEMNLAEYPITLLSYKAPKGIKTIEYTDWVTIDGRKKPLKWIVTGSEKYGLPIGGDQDVYVAIMEVWRRYDFKDKVIPIGSIYQMVKKMGLPINKQNYNRFKCALDRLTGTYITSENAFWDKDGQCYLSKKGFHLFDEYQLIEKHKKSDNTVPLPFGYIRASEFFYQSVKKGYLKDIDLNFYFSLPTPLTKRLYRYLNKKKYLSASFSMEIYKFTRKIGLMVGNVEKYYPSKIKQILSPALDELKSKGFLKNYTYQNTSKGKNTKIVFTFSQLPKQVYQANGEEYKIDLLVEDILEVCEDEKSTGFYKKVARLLPQQDIYQAISEVKEVRDLGEVKKNKGAIFTSLIKKYARERGLDL